MRQRDKCPYPSCKSRLYLPRQRPHRDFFTEYMLILRRVKPLFRSCSIPRTYHGTSHSTTESFRPRSDLCPTNPERDSAFLQRISDGGYGLPRGGVRPPMVRHLPYELLRLLSHLGPHPSVRWGNFLYSVSFHRSMVALFFS